jgi:hypothetical protein
MQTGNLRLFALLSTIGAWMVMALSLLVIVVIVLWSAYRDPYNELDPLTGILALTTLTLNAVYLGSVIPVLLWIYTAHTNLRAGGMKGLRHSPAWATISFFVPVANLFVPFAAMRELANRSAGEPEEFAESSVDEVTSWWACWVTSAIVMTIFAIIMMVDSMPGISVVAPIPVIVGIQMFGQILFAGSAFFLIKVMRLVTNNQINGSIDLTQFE